MNLASVSQNSSVRELQSNRARAIEYVYRENIETCSPVCKRPERQPFYPFSVPRSPSFTCVSIYVLFLVYTLRLGFQHLTVDKEIDYTVFPYQYTINHIYSIISKIDVRNSS